MAATYGYSLDRDAVEILLQCSARDRRRLVESFQLVARYPFAAGDVSQQGLDGREHQLLDVGDFVVTYWTDHATKTVRILSIDRT